MSSEEKKLMLKTLGGLMETLNPNHIDLNLYYPIGGQIVKHTSLT